MITLQILDPDSKLSYVKKRQASLNYLLEGKRDYHEDTFYGALDKLDEAFVSLREQLNAATPATSRVLLYDLSNSYFCGTQAELGGYGHSKEKRHDRYMVSYGLVTREDGTPLDIRVWKGGTADAKTVHQTFCNWKADYHACQAIWIADRSMSDEGTLEEVREMDLSYITGLPGTAQRAVLSKMQESQPSLFDQQLTEFTHNERRYILCRHQHKGYREEKANHRNLRKVYDALKHIRKTPQNADKQKLYHRAMKVLEKYRQTHCWRLSFEQYQDQKGKTRYRLVYQFDRRAFKAHNAIAHYYVLQTDLSSQALSPVEAQQFYKRLLTVERNFRTVKSDMEIRPVRHRKASRIRGHIYLNFLALWLVKQIELAWKAKGQHDEVAAKLRHWDSRMMIHELVDEQSGQVMEWQWNTGVAAQEVFQEAQRFGEMGSDPPHL
jgi:transposase